MRRQAAVVVVVEDGDGELVAAQIRPDVLHRIEFGRIGWQVHEGDVVGNDKIVRDVIAGAVEEEGGVGAGSDLAADLCEMQRQHLGVGGREDERGRGAALGAGRAEEVGPVVALIARRARPGSALGPDPGQRALLADARLVLEPDFERLVLGVVGEPRRQGRGKVFLNVACSAASLSGWRGRTESRR